MKVRPAITGMEAYHPPLDERAEKDYLLLDFSESTQPPPPAVLEALRDYTASGRMRMYPSYGRFPERLAEYVGTGPETAHQAGSTDPNSIGHLKQNPGLSQMGKRRLHELALIQALGEGGL